ncbi:MAG: CcdB family protein [Pseudooceanicola sp.]|nr:CcdB family protein [Pseudooceanicola sp.]
MRDRGELVCRVQTDLGVETPYVLCAPVVRRLDWGALVPKLHIPVDLDGLPHVIVVSQVVAIPGRMLGPAVADLSAWRDEIIAAVDLLVSGF